MTQKHKRCTEPGCSKSAISPTDKCKAHGGGKRCTEPGCTKSARDQTDKCFAHGGGKQCTESGCSKSAQGQTDKCKAHGGGKRCTEPGCSKSAISPTDKCKAHGGGNRCPNCITWPDSRCGSTTYDGATLLCIETDEFGHAGYDPKDEELRYDDLYMIHSGKWVFIRFNPDGKGVDMVDKLVRLMEEIQIQIDRIENDENNELLEIIKLYY